MKGFSRRMSAALTDCILVSGIGQLQCGFGSTTQREVDQNSMIKSSLVRHVVWIAGYTRRLPQSRQQVQSESKEFVSFSVEFMQRKVSAETEAH